MEPVFTIQYGEYTVAEYLSDKIKDASVFIPASAQQKGIDLLMYRYNGRNETCTVQVKMSRTYFETRKKTRPSLPYGLWFNRFEIQGNADWYVLVGIYAVRKDSNKENVNNFSWESIKLAFRHDEMKQFMEEVRQKKDPTKEDRMFGFGFDDSRRIFQTRGYPTKRDMSRYLIENRLDEIRQSFK